MSTLRTDFRKCAACTYAADRGDHKLCPGCVHNRAVIDLLNREAEERAATIPSEGRSFWFQFTGALSALVCFAFVALPFLVCVALFRRKQAEALGVTLRNFIAAFSKL